MGSRSTASISSRGIRDRGAQRLAIAPRRQLGADEGKAFEHIRACRRKPRRRRGGSPTHDPNPSINRNVVLRRFSNADLHLQSTGCRFLALKIGKARTQAQGGGWMRWGIAYRISVTQPVTQ